MSEAEKLAALLDVVDELLAAAQPAPMSWELNHPLNGDELYEMLKQAREAFTDEQEKP